MEQGFSVDFIFVIPGSGQDHPVQPGESLLLALDASNHTEANPNSFDLSVADFEFYDESIRTPTFWIQIIRKYPTWTNGILTQLLTPAYTTGDSIAMP